MSDLLAARLRQLEPELVEHLRREFPDVPLDAPLRFRPVPTLSAHHLVVVETSRGVTRRLLIKGPPRHDRRPGRSIETRLLADVGPQIAAHNPSIRCPRMVACYPDDELLVLEMVEGPTLASLLFGRPALRARVAAAEYLDLCGAWLARFHDLTRTGQEGNPFAWLTKAFEDPASRVVFERHAGGALYRSLCQLARRLLHDHPTVRAPLCAIHGSFTANHILVQRHQIYVIDLESSSIGYPMEDLATFAGFLEILAPWRRALAARSLPPSEQLRRLLESYSARTAPLTGPETLVLRLARLLAIAKLLRDLDKFTRRDKSVTSWLLRPWRRHRFRLACRRELAALHG